MSKKKPQARPTGRPEGVEDWSLEQIEDHITELREHPDIKAVDALRGLLNSAITNPDIMKSELILFFIEVMQQCIDDFQPGWDLDDLLHNITSASSRLAQSASTEKAKRAKEYVIKAWIAEGKPRGERERFSDRMVVELEQQKMGTYHSSNIRSHWISKKSVEEFEGKTGGQKG